MKKQLRLSQIFACALIALSSPLCWGEGAACRDLFAKTARDARSFQTPDWVRAEFPAIYSGVTRAVGAERASAFFQGMHRDDLRATDKKFDDFRRHIIEHLRDPNQSNSVPRLYSLEIFGSLGEAIALAEFRRNQPADVSVVGDPARGSSEGASRRRPDGMAFKIENETSTSRGKIKIFSLLESKISKTSATGFKSDQYTTMRKEWAEFGLELNGQVFRPDQIEMVIGSKNIPIDQVTDENFLDSVYLYQPSAYSMTSEQRARAGIKHLMPVLFEPWVMRYVGFSVTSQGLHPYLPDRFGEFQHDMTDLVGFYRSAGAVLNLASPKNEGDSKAKEILGKYDVEQLSSAIATLAPDLFSKIKGDQTVYAPKRVEIAPKKSALAAKNDFDAWKAGQLVIDDPIELIQLQIHYDSDVVFNEFLRARAHWPQPVDLSQATEKNAVALIVEDRFYSRVQRAGGPLSYLLLAMKKSDAREFLKKSRWRPDKQAVESFLNSAGNNQDKRTLHLNLLTLAFGADGWGLDVGEQGL